MPKAKAKAAAREAGAAAPVVKENQAEPDSGLEGARVVEPCGGDRPAEAQDD